MKNKKLLLVATAALGLVAVATAGVGTAAWYQASNVANISTQAKDQAFTTALSSTDLGDFKITVVSAAFDAQPVMTDASGNTYAVTSDGDLVTASVPDGKVKIATVTVTIKVDYEGTAVSANDAVANLWQATLGDDDILVTASATGTLSSRIKYTASASAYTNVSGKNVLTVANETAAAWTFSTKSTGNKEISTKMYIGVDGGATSGTVQNDGTSAIETTITFTPSHS